MGSLYSRFINYFTPSEPTRLTQAELDKVIDMFLYEHITDAKEKMEMNIIR